MAFSSNTLTTPSIRLNDGHMMPMVGLGAYLGANDSLDELTKLTLDAVRSAIDIGYRHIDTAFYYNTEIGIGQAIKEKIQEGVISRSDIFVTTKLWSTHHRRVVPALRNSLSNLGLDYVDMYLVHLPVALKESGKPLGRLDVFNDVLCDNEASITDTWKGMEECRKLGLTRSIGVSNFNHLQLQRILDSCTVKPANNQIEVHPYLANKKLIEFCEHEGIVVTAYSPLGLPNRSWAKPDEPCVAADTTINRIAKKYKKSCWQVCLRFQTQRGLAVIPKSVNPQRQRENLDIFDFELNTEDIKAMYDCNRNFRAYLGVVNWTEAKEWPFHEDW